MDEYMLIEEEGYSVRLLVDKLDFDYYTDVILELISQGKKIILLKDNILYLKNTINIYLKNIDEYILDKRLDENQLGLLLNEYHYCISEDIEKDSIILNEEGEWIGERYCCFHNKKYATWIYINNGDLIIKVTPVFEIFNDNKQLKDIVSKKETIDIFYAVITHEKLKEASKIILNLYNMVFN